MYKACIAGVFLLAACSSGPTAPKPSTPSPTEPVGTTPDSPTTPVDPTAPIDPTSPTSPTPGDPSPTTPPDTTPPRATGPGTHTRCGWINTPDGYTTFQQHPTEFEAIHPKWHVMQADGTIRNAGITNDAALRATAAANGVAVIPLIDADHDKVRIRAMITDANKRAAHIAALMKVVDNNNYDGIDIDYESLWSSSDRAPFTTFMTELSAALHSRGKELAMAIPGTESGNNNNGYDYDALVGVVDTMHVMGYDFHWLSGDHLGPLAPLGWIDAVFAHAQATGHPERFILGVPNYGIGSGFFSNSMREAQAMCTGPVLTTTDHMASCPYGHFEAGRAVHCNTSKGTIWFDDLQAMEEKIAAAKSHGARGVTYWTVGDEAPGYFDLVRRYYP